MVSRSKKNELYKLNGLAEDRYRQLVAEDVAKEIPPSEENAILRKAVAYLFELIATLHPDEVRNEEFRAYHAKVEEIKRHAKAEMEVDS